MIKRYRGHQYQYTGHCISFAQEIIKTVSILPNLLEELDIILLRPSRQAIDNPQYRRQFQHDFRVRKSYILTWLRFLQARHPDYRYITICNDRIQSFPDDGDVSHLLPALDTGEDEGPDPQDVSGLENDPQLPNTQSTIPNSSADDTEINQILQELTGQNLRDIDVPAPSICTTPIDEAAGTQRIFAMAFPTLYPLGRADFNAPRQRAVTLKEYAYHLMRYSDGRFGRHPRWRFLVFNILMRRKSTNSARYYVSKASNMINLTREELGEALNSDSNLLPQIVR
jgi:ATP-dependent DNA helicase PIF1